MQATNSTHSIILTPVTLRKEIESLLGDLPLTAMRARIIFRRKPILGEEVEELLSPELNDPFGFGGISPQQPLYRRASKRMMVTEVKRLQKIVKLLDELVYEIFAADGVLAVPDDNVVNVEPADGRVFMLFVFFN